MLCYSRESELSFTVTVVGNMNRNFVPRQSRDTGLLRGDAAVIARIHRMSCQHVVEVAAGRRPGNPKLQRTIERYRAKAAAVAALDHAEQQGAA